MSTKTPTIAQPSLTPEQVEMVRAHHRGTRNLAFLLCLAGVLIMITGRFAAAAPVWLVSVGLGVVVFGWGLLFYSLMRRVALARSLSSQAGG